MQTPPSYEEIISKYDWPDDIAIQVYLHEGGRNEMAYNPEWHYKTVMIDGVPTRVKDCQGSYGLFQMGCIHLRENPKLLWDPELNVKMAYELYKREGWRPWSVCLNGTVNCGNGSK